MYKVLFRIATLKSALTWQSLYATTHITLAKSGNSYYLTFNDATSNEVITALSTLKSYAPNNGRPIKTVMYTHYGNDDAIYLALFSLDSVNCYCTVISSFGATSGSDFFGSAHKLVGSASWVYG